jgi:hypothetical protein
MLMENVDQVSSCLNIKYKVKASWIVFSHVGRFLKPHPSRYLFLPVSSVAFTSLLMGEVQVISGGKNCQTSHYSADTVLTCTGTIVTIISMYSMWLSLQVIILILYLINVPTVLNIHIWRTQISCSTDMIHTTKDVCKVKSIKQNPCQHYFKHLNHLFAWPTL